MTRLLWCNLVFSELPGLGSNNARATYDSPVLQEPLLELILFALPGACPSQIGGQSVGTVTQELLRALAELRSLTGLMAQWLVSLTAAWWCGRIPAASNGMFKTAGFGKCSPEVSQEESKLAGLGILTVGLFEAFFSMTREIKCSWATVGKVWETSTIYLSLK